MWLKTLVVVEWPRACIEWHSHVEINLNKLRQSALSVGIIMRISNMTVAKEFSVCSVECLDKGLCRNGLPDGSLHCSYIICAIAFCLVCEEGWMHGS